VFIKVPYNIILIVVPDKPRLQVGENIANCRDINSYISNFQFISYNKLIFFPLLYRLRLHLILLCNNFCNTWFEHIRFVSYFLCLLVCIFLYCIVFFLKIKNNNWERNNRERNLRFKFLLNYIVLYYHYHSIVFCFILSDIRSKFVNSTKFK